MSNAERKTNISIVTATCNAARTIADCLRSVAAQTHPAEHIIIDAVSTDATIDIVRELNPHARILSEPDSGIYDAMNKGITLATGDVIGILNADDWYASPRVLERVARVFEEPELMCCYGDLVYVREARDSGVGNRQSEASSQSFSVVRYWHSGEFKLEKLYQGWMPPHPTFFVRKSVYDRFGMFSLDLSSAADYELMLRFLLKHRITTAYLPEVLVKMRVGGASNASLAARLKANRMDRKAWKINGLNPYPWTLLCKPLRKLGQYFIKK